MGGARKIVIEEQELLEVDYSGAREAEMIDIVVQAAEILEKENKPLPVISIFSFNNYATPAFMGVVRKKLLVHENLIVKQAIVGLSATQKMILMGLNILLQRNFKAFETKEEAVRYLLDKNTTDHDLPDYFRRKKN
jgi:hypothetical protein